MIATTHYVDEVKGLDERLKDFRAAETGVELLETCVEAWGNYIPDIYGLAKALLMARETDEAADAAWNDCMSCLHDACRIIIETLCGENLLASMWTSETAIEMLCTLLSIQMWEQLTADCGWSTLQYVDRMKALLKRTFVVKADGEG